MEKMRTTGKKRKKRRERGGKRKKEKGREKRGKRRRERKYWGEGGQLRFGIRDGRR
jgi:hypothetical protein